MQTSLYLDLILGGPLTSLTTGVHHLLLGSPQGSVNLRPRARSGLLSVFV